MFVAYCPKLCGLLTFLASSSLQTEEVLLSEFNEMENSGGQRGEATCPRSHSSYTAELR